MSTTATRSPAPDTGAGPRRRPGLLSLLLGAVVLAVLLRTFLVQAFDVPTGSMEPLIRPGDRVLVNRTDRSPQRGDVVVFDGTQTFGGPSVTPPSPGLIGRVVNGVGHVFGIDPAETDYVKRVAGTGGDRVTCTKGDLKVNGTPVVEPYLAAGATSCAQDFDVQVPDGHLFLLGDNRAESADSRAHLGAPGGGMVPVDDVIGTVWVRYWPLDRAGSIRTGEDAA